MHDIKKYRFRDLTSLDKFRKYFSTAIRKYLSEIDFFENYKIDNIRFRLLCPKFLSIFSRIK